MGIRRENMEIQLEACKRHGRNGPEMTEKNTRIQVNEISSSPPLMKRSKHLTPNLVPNSRPKHSMIRPVPSQRLTDRVSPSLASWTPGSVHIE